MVGPHFGIIMLWFLVQYSYEKNNSYKFYAIWKNFPAKQEHLFVPFEFSGAKNPCFYNCHYTSSFGLLSSLESTICNSFPRAQKAQFYETKRLIF